MGTKDIKIPDIGDFANVPVIEIMVAPGDTIAEDDPLIALESDKATMDIPSPQAGVVHEVKVALDDTVSKGDVILTITPVEETQGLSESPPARAASADTADTKDTANTASIAATPASTPVRQPQDADLHADIVVLGAGPGGYTAAFRAADLGRSVILVDRRDTLGGVCLNVGCIPSKALLHAAKVIEEAAHMEAHGITFGKPKTDIKKLTRWKEGVVAKLTGGLAALAKARKVTTVRGEGRFLTPHTLEVANNGTTKTIAFEQAIIAAGSEPVVLPFVPHDDERVIDSTGALAMANIPKRLLVIGGGIIGLEMATVYAALGSRITVVELMDQLIPGADKDIVRPLHSRLKTIVENILLSTKVSAVEAQKTALKVVMQGPEGEMTERFDKVLVAVGRRPNGDLINAGAAGVAVENGFIAVDRQMRTNVAHIFAIGDVIGQPMLAHKAVHEGKVAAEVACAKQATFDARVIPSVAYTDPEVAWAGVTETEAKKQKMAYVKGVFPWAASGRALSLGRDEGVTKLLFDKDSKRIIGAGIVGPGAGELIAEIALAIEMGADAEDLGLTIHPHPTLSETVALAAEMVTGAITDLMPPKR